MNQSKIGFIIPTRGLVYSQVEQRVEELRTSATRVYRSHDLVIPEGHNRLTQQALEDGCEWIFYIEEDTVPPPGALAALIQADSDIACIDYSVNGWGCVTKNPAGAILWCGLGCTLVKRHVFAAMDKPYFRADRVLRLNDWTWQPLPDEYIRTKQYGSLDIWFCTQARLLGFTIAQAPGECVHLQLEEFGKRETNHGVHLISARPAITKRQIVESEVS